MAPPRSCPGQPQPPALTAQPRTGAAASFPDMCQVCFSELGSFNSFKGTQLPSFLQRCSHACEFLFKHARQPHQKHFNFICRYLLEKKKSVLEMELILKVARGWDVLSQCDKRVWFYVWLSSKVLIKGTWGKCWMWFFLILWAAGGVGHGANRQKIPGSPFRWWHPCWQCHAWLALPWYKRRWGRDLRELRVSYHHSQKTIGALTLLYNGSTCIKLGEGSEDMGRLLDTL